MVIVGLDLSTTCQGFQIYKNGNLVKYGAIKPKNKEWEERVREIANVVDQLFDEYNPTTLIIEDVPLRRDKVPTLYKLAVLHGYVRRICDEHDTDVVLYTPTVWRAKLKMFDGTNDSKKREVLKQKAIDMANDIYNLELKKKDDDIAEAIMIGRSYLIDEGVLNNG